MFYRHLTQDERYQIDAMTRAGFSAVAIGQHLQRHPSTIGRERRRNGQGQCYRARRAQQIATERRHHACSHPQLTACMAAHIDLCLGQRLSPEQIHGRSRLLGQPMLSRTSVYRHIHRQGWRHRLRHKRRRRGYGCGRAQRFTDRRSIQQRPAEVVEGTRLGDWELDTVRPSRGRGVLVTINERVSGFVRLGWCAAGKAQEVAFTIAARLARLRKHVHTLTCDRGSEFADDAYLEQALTAQVYFADPHAPWQRGRNENLNGLLREYFPRHRDFETITPEELQQVENALNDRPRKRLSFLTPAEVFFNYQTLALRG